MEAIIYENFIRQVYSCSRFEVEAANADIYRRLEVADRAYDDYIKDENNSNNDDQELGFYAGFHTGIVTTHITAALGKIVNDKKELLSEDQLLTLTKVLPLILVAPNKSIIDMVINQASDILKNIGVTAP